MRIRRSAAAWVAACLAVAAVSVAAPAPPPIPWEKDFDKGVARARQEKKPLLLDFWATWCGPCREMEASLWSRPDVVALSHKFVPVRIDIDRTPSLASRFRAGAVPTVVLSDPWGTEFARREGFSRPDEHVALLKASPADFTPIAAWHERLAADPADVEALGAVGHFYYRAAVYQTSRDFYARALKTRTVKASPPLMADTLTAIGWNELKMGHARQARKEFERCLEIVPDHPGLAVTLYGLLSACLVQGERAAAEGCLVRLDACCAASPVVALARRDLGLPPRP